MIVHDDTLSGMKRLIEQWDACGDKRAVFLKCYSLMTRNMLIAADSREFNDNAWVRALLHRFADYYFYALEAFDCNDPSTPAVWRFAHDAAGKSDVMILQHLFLGINAHINFDLILTLVELLENDWAEMPAPMRRGRYRDHCKVNEIIARTIDEVQDVVIAAHVPAMKLADAALGRLDEWALSRLIGRWREQVWTNAHSLMDAPRGGNLRKELIAAFDAIAVERGKAVLFRDGISSLKRLL